MTQNGGKKLFNVPKLRTPIGVNFESVRCKMCSDLNYMCDISTFYNTHTTWKPNKPLEIPNCYLNISAQTFNQNSFVNAKLLGT